MFPAFGGAPLVVQPAVGGTKRYPEQGHALGAAAQGLAQTRGGAQGKTRKDTRPGKTASLLSAALLNVCPHEQEHQECTKMMSQRKNDLKTPKKSRDRTVNNMRSADEHPRCHDGDASRRFL